MIQQLKDASEDLVFLCFFTLPPMVSLSFKAGSLVGCTVASNISLVMCFFLCIQKETENDFSPMFSANILKFTLTGPGPVIGPITFCRWMDLSDGLSQGHDPGVGGRVSFLEAQRWKSAQRSTDLSPGRHHVCPCHAFPHHVFYSSVFYACFDNEES